MIRNDQALSASAEADLARRLRALPSAPGPDARFRDELRVQLLATVERSRVIDGFAPDALAAPARPRFAPVRLVRPGEPARPAQPARPARPGRPARHAQPARPSRLAGLVAPFLHPGRRVVAVLGAAMAVLLVITGTTYWLAQRALPGDALYGLKRVSESVDLSTKGGDVSRGSAYLSLSSTRIDEAFALVKRDSSAAAPGVVPGRTGISAAGPLSPHVDELVHGVLAEGDTAAVTATRLLTTASVSNRAMKPASTVSSWLVDQHTKVGDLVARLPETAPSTAGGAARLLQHDLARIQTRVKAIAASVKCGTCRFTNSDSLGPLPCRTCPARAPSPRPTQTTHSPTATTTAPKPSSTVSTPTTTTPVPVPPVPVPGSTPGTTGVGTPAPTPTPTPPATTPPSPTTQPPPPTTTPPATTATSVPPTTVPPTTTDPTTTEDPSPTLPSDCLPLICSDAPGSGNVPASGAPPGPTTP